MSLPQFQDGSTPFQMMQNVWAAQIDPVIKNPANQSILLKSVALVNGTTALNHLLGRKLQGWNVIRQRAAASIYDAQDNNQTPDKTLVLISNAAVVVDLEVF